MKKIFKNKRIVLIVLIVLAVLIGGIGFGIYKVQSDKKGAETKNSDNNQNNKNDTAKSTSGKSDNPPADATGTGAQATPAVNSAVGDLKEVSLTVYLVSESTTSQDGKTTVPAGSMQPYFYMPAGVYTVQKLVGATWVDVATNINYSGHGGLLASFAGPTEDNVNYRVLNMVGGKQTAVSKIFIVKRSDLSGGVHTYN